MMSSGSRQWRGTGTSTARSTLKRCIATLRIKGSGAQTPEEGAAAEIEAGVLVLDEADAGELE